MRNKRIILAVAIVLFAAIGYVIPIIVSSSNARCLYGNFDIRTKCMDGHEVFLCLEEDKAYENCPGHQSKDPIGRVERTAHSATVFWKDTDDPFYRVDYRESTYTLVFPDDSSRHTIHQVNNPWRTWLPRFLLGH